MNEHGILIDLSWPALIGFATLVATAWGLHIRFSTRATRSDTLLGEHLKQYTDDRIQNRSDHADLFELVNKNANQIGQIAQIAKVKFE